MSEKNGLPIAPPKPILKKSLKIDFGKFGQAVAKAAANAAIGQFEGMTDGAVDALASIGLKAGPAEVGWLLCYRGSLRAVTQLFNENAEVVGSFDAIELKKFLGAALGTRTLSMSDSFFIAPEKNEVTPAVKLALLEWLKQKGLPSAQANNVASRFPIYLAAGLNDEWASSPTTYAVLQLHLDTPFTRADERARAFRAMALKGEARRARSGTEW
jgi:hypothetical protein